MAKFNTIMNNIRDKCLKIYVYFWDQSLLNGQHSDSPWFRGLPLDAVKCSDDCGHYFLIHLLYTPTGNMQVSHQVFLIQIYQLTMLPASYLSCAPISLDFWPRYSGFSNIAGIILANCGKSTHLIYMLIGMTNYFHDIHLKGSTTLESNFISRTDVRRASRPHTVKCEFS